MGAKIDKTKLIPAHGAGSGNEGYPVYPPGEDIYNQHQIEANIDPEDITRIKSAIILDDRGISNEKEFLDDVSGSDLDVPGSELDDVQENAGNEDEENNFYSLGGDGHSNLDEY